MAEWPTRAASAADLAPLRSLLADSCDASVVPSVELLAHAIDRDLVRVAESAGELVGCAVAEMPSSGHVRISAIAVHEETRGQGLAKKLLTDLVEETLRKSTEPPLISAVARTDQLAVIRLLLACDFKGTRVMHANGAGDGLRIHFQRKSRMEYIDPDARHLVPATDHAQLLESLSPADHAVTGLVTLGGQPAFELARFEQDDPATLQSGEAAAGIAFSGSILAAITFLLGFAFSSTRFPDDVRLLLIGATFSTVLSLIIYASASGELARIRSNSFGKIMKWGNVLSEYGGVFLS